MPPKKDESVPKLTRTATQSNTSTNGIENPIDPDAPREGRLATISTRPSISASRRGTGTKIAYVPKIVQRRKKEGASESLLSIGESGSNDADVGPSDARRRATEHSRGRGRGRGVRPDVPLTASGPFAQGPAISSIPSSRGRGTSFGSRPSGPSHSTASGTRVNQDASLKRESKVSKSEGDEEMNLDDAGQPMQNLLRMQQDRSGFWAPVTTERIERATKESAIAVPGEASKLVRVKKEVEDLGFIDVKTEPTESTLTSRVPSPEAVSHGDISMPDAPQADESDDDIALPITAPSAPVTEQKPNVPAKKEKTKTKVQVMTAEEAEEQDRFSTDLETLRLNLTQEDDYEKGNLIFIQLPAVLPLWQPSVDDNKQDEIKEEVKQEIVEIDQKNEDGKEASTGKPAASAPKENEAPAPVVPEEPKAKKKKKKVKPVAFPPPEGLVGQLHIHQSGRMTCDWGGIKMEVGSGSDCGFLQEVVVVHPNPADKTAWSLGRIGTRMVMAPDLNDILL